MSKTEKELAVELLLQEPLTGSRFNIPESILKVINEFQSAYKTKYDRKISRESVMLLMLSEALPDAKIAIHEMLYGDKQSFFFTFGSNHQHSVKGVELDSHCFVKIVAEDHQTARNKMYDLCGLEWSMMYTEEEFFKSDPLQHFRRGCLLEIEA